MSSSWSTEVKPQHVYYTIAGLKSFIQGTKNVIFNQQFARSESTQHLRMPYLS